MNRFIDRALNDPFSNDVFPQAIGWMPGREIIETADELLLTAELPGMEQKNIDVSVEDGVLTLRGEKLEKKKKLRAKSRSISSSGTMARSSVRSRFRQSSIVPRSRRRSTRAC